MKIGSRVKKVTGDYQITGIVRSVFTNGNGLSRVVVEHYVTDPQGSGSFLHIYAPSNLEVLDEPEADAQQNEEKSLSEAIKAAAVSLGITVYSTTLDGRTILLLAEDLIKNHKQCQLDLQQSNKKILLLEGFLKKATGAMNLAHSSMFKQCLSNPIFNAWGKQIDTRAINALQDESREIHCFLGTYNQNISSS